MSNILKNYLTLYLPPHIYFIQSRQFKIKLHVNYMLELKLSFIIKEKTFEKKKELERKGKIIYSPIFIY